MKVNVIKEWTLDECDLIGEDDNGSRKREWNLEYMSIEAFLKDMEYIIDSRNFGQILTIKVTDS